MTTSHAPLTSLRRRWLAWQMVVLVLLGSVISGRPHAMNLSALGAVVMTDVCLSPMSTARNDGAEAGSSEAPASGSGAPHCQWCPAGAHTWAMPASGNACLMPIELVCASAPSAAISVLPAYPRGQGLPRGPPSLLV